MKLASLLPFVGLINFSMAVGFDQLAVLKCLPRDNNQELFRGSNVYGSPNSGKDYKGMKFRNKDCLNLCWCNPAEKLNSGVTCKEAKGANGQTIDKMSLEYMCATDDGGNCRCFNAGQNAPEQKDYKLHGTQYKRTAEATPSPLHGNGGRTYGESGEK